MATRTRKPYEAPAVGAAAGRMIKGLVKRAAAGDTEALEQLLALDDVLQAATRDAGAALHDFGYSWAELGQVAGTTRQGAASRFRRP